VGTGADRSRRSRFTAADLGNTPAHRSRRYCGRRNFVSALSISGHPQGQPAHRAIWWLLIRQDEIEVCLKDPRQKSRCSRSRPTSAPLLRSGPGISPPRRSSRARASLRFRGNRPLAIAQVYQMLKLTDEDRMAGPRHLTVHSSCALITSKASDPCAMFMPCFLTIEPHGLYRRYGRSSASTVARRMSRLRRSADCPAL